MDSITVANNIDECLYDSLGMEGLTVAGDRTAHTKGTNCITVARGLGDRGCIENNFRKTISPTLNLKCGNCRYEHAE